MSVDQHPYVSTRRTLRGVAEALVAGPQYRATGTIRLAVQADGFVGASIALGVRGATFTWPGGAAPLDGSPRALAEAAGVDIGPPDGVYDVVDPLDPGADLHVDATAAELLYRGLYAGSLALKRVLPENHPVLWPEHFDVATTEAEVNYGVSAGDDHHPTPYAYVGPWTPRTGPFWNAPFGAAHPLDLTHDAEQLAAAVAGFFIEGRRRVADG